jgi:hypothetical protein
MLAGYGYSVNDRKTYGDTDLRNIVGVSDKLRDFAKTENGATYYMDNGKKRIFPNWQTFTTLGPSLSSDGSLSANNFSYDFMGSIPSGAPVLLDGSTVKASGKYAIYLFDQGVLRLFTPTSWKAWGGKLDHTLSSNLVDQINKSGLAPMLITNGGAKYLVNSGNKNGFNSSTLTTWGLSDDKFSSVSNRALDRLATGSAPTNLIRKPNGAVYLLSNGKRYLVPSRQDFDKAGYKWSDVTDVDNATVEKISDSQGKAFAPGSLVRHPNGAVFWIDKNLTAHRVPSQSMFYNYGFRWSEVRRYNQNVLGGYTIKTLQHLVSASSKNYVVDKGKRLNVNSNTYGVQQYDFAGSNASSVSDTLLNKIVLGGDLTQFLQGSGKAVYKVEAGKKRPFRNVDSFYANGGSWDKVTRVSDSFLQTIPTGSSY